MSSASATLRAAPARGTLAELLPTRAAWMLAGRALRRHWLRWVASAGALASVYYVGLVGVMALRLGQLPNYGHVYSALSAYSLIWSSTPSTRDALAIMADEPLFEVGYKMPEFGISEWSLMVGLPNVLQVLAGASLLAAFLLMTALARRAGCPLRPRAAAAAGAGAGMLALASASLTWVVCCATPSWIVALSLLGVSLGLAQALGPFEAWVVGAGSIIALLAIGWQASRIEQAGGLGRAFPAAPSESMSREGATQCL